MRRFQQQQQLHLVVLVSPRRQYRPGCCRVRIGVVVATAVVLLLQLLSIFVAVLSSSSFSSPSSLLSTTTTMATAVDIERKQDVRYSKRTLRYNWNEKETEEETEPHPTLRLTATGVGTAAAAEESDQDENNDAPKKKRNKALLKIYILAGQSNMVGYGSISHLKDLIQSPASSSSSSFSSSASFSSSSTSALNRNKDAEEEYAHLQDSTTGDWTILHENLYCNWLQKEDEEDVQQQYANNTSQSVLLHRRKLLRVGDTSSHNTNCGLGASHNTFGPEIGFGSVVAASLVQQQTNNNNNTSGNGTRDTYDTDTDTDTDIVLLKFAWDGYGLHTNFRPPSSRTKNNKYNNNNNNSQYDNQDDDTNGASYDLMIKTTKRILADLQRTNNNITNNDTTHYAAIQLSGFVWFQGYTDYMDTYDTTHKCDGDNTTDTLNNGYNEYGYHLRNLVQDLRHDLPNAIHLPVVMGELGIGMRSPVDFQYMGCTNGENDAATDIDCDVETSKNALLTQYQDRLQQFQTIQQQQSANNTIYVPTEQYLLPEENHDEDDTKNDDATDDATSTKRRQYDNGYHYYGRADTIYRIGEAFGTAMLQLEERQQQHYQKQQHHNRYPSSSDLTPTVMLDPWRLWHVIAIPSIVWIMIIM